MSALVICAGCVDHKPYVCATSDQCVKDGAPGVCEPQGFCSFDDASWSEPRACASTSIWGTAVAGLESQGARWVWWNADCNDLSNAWFRLTFTVD